jgi:uncharacterized membrane protein (UPF0127 family)
MEQATVRRKGGVVVCERCAIASTPLARTRGLLGRNELPPGEGILLRPAGSIHTAFMRFPIDAVFFDRELRVIRIARNLLPWRLAAARGARAVLELPAGEAERRRIEVGDCLELAADPKPVALENSRSVTATCISMAPCLPINRLGPDQARSSGSRPAVPTSTSTTGRGPVN